MDLGSGIWDLESKILNLGSGILKFSEMELPMNSSQRFDSNPCRTFKGIFFDVGGTLLFPDPEVIRHWIKRSFGRRFDFSEVLRAVEFGSVALDNAMDTNATAVPQPEWWETCFGSLLTFLGVSWEIGSETFSGFLDGLRTHHRNSNLWSHVIPGTHKILEKLSRKKYFLGVISNSDGRVLAQLEQAKLEKYFSFILDSHVVGCEKPNKEIFLMALRKSGLPPEQVLFIGDIIHIDAKGSGAVGISPLILDPLGKRKNSGIPRISSLMELPDWLDSIANGTRKFGRYTNIASASFE
ncbi:hypothetical protein AUK22_04530 [bacterium CG2_30_54_10]|nr:MAG: hypothetical protein AUK22_04530 [bacterium CG2_30_54_10]